MEDKGQRVGGTTLGKESLTIVVSGYVLESQE